MFAIIINFILLFNQTGLLNGKGVASVLVVFPHQRESGANIGKQKCGETTKTSGCVGRYTSEKATHSRLLKNEIRARARVVLA